MNCRVCENRTISFLRQDDIEAFVCPICNHIQIPSEIEVKADPPCALEKVSDPISYLSEIADSLSERGAVSFEVYYGANLIKHRDADQFSSERLSYFTAKSLWAAFRSAGLFIYEVKEDGDNLCGLAVASKQDDTQIMDLVTKEYQDGIYSMEAYSGYQTRVNDKS